MNALWESHIKVAAPQRERRPPGVGWMTLRDFAKSARIGEAKARLYVRGCLRAVPPTMESFSGSLVVQGSPIPRRMVWYRPIEKKR